MTQAIVKLRSFAATGLAAARFSRQAIEQAYAEGYEDGQTDAISDERSKLSREIAALSDLLTQEQARRHQLHQQAVAALAPILSEIVDCLAGSGLPQQLEAQLQGELSRLASQARPIQCKIICPETARPMVMQCIDAVGASGIAVETAPGDVISLKLIGGHIEFDKQAAIRSIRGLIDELTEVEK